MWIALSDDSSIDQRIRKGAFTMEIELGGLVAYAFKVFLGNPDVMAVLLTWAVGITLVLVAYRIYEDLTG
jgi:hypothetical protein